VSQTKDRLQIIELNKKIKSKQVEIDSLTYLTKDLQNYSNSYIDSNIIKQQTLYFLVNKNEGLGLKDLAALLISVLALLLSFIVLNKQNWNKNLDFISEIDKQFITDPTLWAIYDLEASNYPLSKSSLTEETDAERKGKLRAFCYYKLNNFESVFLSTYKWSKTRKAWEAYMVHLIVESSLFKDVIEEASDNYIYNINYRKRLIKFIELAESLKKSYDTYKAAPNITAKKNYHNAAKKILKIK